jgi:hypothetical protein
MRLPKAEQNLGGMADRNRRPDQRAAEGRDFLMHARIAMLRAINHGQPQPGREPRQKRAKTYRRETPSHLIVQTSHQRKG